MIRVASIAFLVGSAPIHAAPASGGHPYAQPHTPPATAQAAPAAAESAPAAAESAPAAAESAPAAAESAPAWNLETSELCRRYRCAASDAGIEGLRRLRDGADASRSAASAAQRRRAEIEAGIRRDCLRELIARGLAVSGQNGVTPERRAALETIATLAHPLELVDAVHVLSGEGFRKNLVASEPDVRNALFRALAGEPFFGQSKLVEFGLHADDELAAMARESLPPVLSASAIAAVEDGLADTRERTVNRAAMIAGAHPAAGLVPTLIQAQFAESPREQQGDEAWIAIGKSTAYVAGLVPVVGNASGAFQPIPGVVYEGSVLRIMESAVTIYRTEVHNALVATVEQTTGQPAPALGFDRDRWMAWYRNEYPQLVRANAQAIRERAIGEGVRTTPARADG